MLLWGPDDHTPQPGVNDLQWVKVQGNTPFSVSRGLKMITHLSEDVNHLCDSAGQEVIPEAAG